MRLVRPRSVPAPVTTTYVQPGTVGFLGSTGALTVIDSSNPYTGSGGSAWNSNDGNRFSQTNLTLDHVWVKGAMYWTGTGTLTITNSIIEGGGGLPWSLWVDAASTVICSDTTFRYSGTFPTTSDSANVAGGNRFQQSHTRCEFTGQPHGIEITTSGAVVESCWIHDLHWNATFDPHLDGIFVFGGNNVSIKHNYIDVTVNSSHATAAIFMQDTFGYGINAPLIWGNYLAGGAFTYFNEAGVSTDNRDNVIAMGEFGEVSTQSPGSTAVWTNNTRPNGTTISQPSP